MALFDDLRARGLWTGYQRYVVALEPVLRGMSERGIPVSPERHAEVTAALTREVSVIEEKMQMMVPDGVKSCAPTLGYKREPKDAVVGALTTHGKDKDGNPQRAVWARRFFPSLVDGVQEERWVKVLQWKPSPTQLIRYMKYRKHRVPQAWKTQRDTTAEIELRRLAKSTADPLYPLVIEYRELLTLLSNHVANWTPREDGRVHPTFYYETGTGQLAARRPNSMNAPHHKPNQGQLFRSMIVAPPGHSLLEFDYKGFHVQTLGFEAQDADLMRMGRIDVHSFLTAHFLRLPDAERCAAWPDDQLREYLADVKAKHGQVRDAKVKHALLGYNNGMGYRKCYYQYMEFFSAQSEAKRVFELLDGLFPRAKEYRERICKVAHEQGYLISRFGCIRWFWEVFKWSGGQWSFGDDHEAALCYFTQNDAHCHLKEAMLRLSAGGWAERFGLNNCIHDSTMWCCPNEHVDQALAVVGAEMERPSIVLVDPVVASGGLVVAVEASVGPSWDRMKKMNWRMR